MVSYDLSQEYVANSVFRFAHSEEEAMEANSRIENGGFYSFKDNVIESGSKGLLSSIG